MNRMIVKSRVGTDGVLHVNVPIGAADANREVQVTIEPAGAPAARSRQDYLDFLQATAGAWQGEFVRPEQGVYEVRDSRQCHSYSMPTSGSATGGRPTRP